MSNLWWINWLWKKFSPSATVVFCQFYPTNAPYSFSFKYRCYYYVQQRTTRELRTNHCASWNLGITGQKCRLTLFPAIRNIYLTSTSVTFRFLVLPHRNVLHSGLPVDGHSLTCKKREKKMKFIQTIFISVINQIDAQNFCFTISLFHASTCFEHHVLIISSPLSIFAPDSHL